MKSIRLYSTYAYDNVRVYYIYYVHVLTTIEYVLYSTASR